MRAMRIFGCAQVRTYVRGKWMVLYVRWVQCCCVTGMLVHRVLARCCIVFAMSSDSRAVSHAQTASRGSVRSRSPFIVSIVSMLVPATPRICFIWSRRVSMALDDVQHKTSNRTLYDPRFHDKFQQEFSVSAAFLAVVSLFRCMCCLYLVSVSMLSWPLRAAFFLLPVSYMCLRDSLTVLPFFVGCGKEGDYVNHVWTSIPLDRSCRIWQETVLHDILLDPHLGVSQQFPLFTCL